jgi:hypothetical protein
MTLRALRIAEPCPENWDAMSGDERARFCARCELSVTNLTELRRAEAEALLSQRTPGQRVCVRVTRDAQQNVITRTTQEERFLTALRALAQIRAAEEP